MIDRMTGGQIDGQMKAKYENKYFFSYADCIEARKGHECSTK